MSFQKEQAWVFYGGVRCKKEKKKWDSICVAQNSKWNEDEYSYVKRNGKWDSCVSVKANYPASFQCLEKKQGKKGWHTTLWTVPKQNLSLLYGTCWTFRRLLGAPYWGVICQGRLTVLSLLYYRDNFLRLTMCTENPYIHFDGILHGILPLGFVPRKKKKKTVFAVNHSLSTLFCQQNGQPILYKQIIPKFLWDFTLLSPQPVIPRVPLI